MFLGRLPPYTCFWEGCSLIYVFLEGLSGKKKGKGPLRHNCTLQVFSCHWLYLGSLPYMSFWERLSGKKMGIEAQLYPKGEVVTGYPPHRDLNLYGH